MHLKFEPLPDIISICDQYLVFSAFSLLLQMTVVEAYVCGNKIDPVDDISQLPSKVASILIEGIAQNTTGSVFISEVSAQGDVTSFLCTCLARHVDSSNFIAI